MSALVEANSRTRNFARVLGPFLTVVSAVVLARAADMKTLLDAFTADPVWPWAVGALLLMGGIAIVAAHSYWRTPAAVVISVLGWIAIVRGFVLLAFPAAFTSIADRTIGAVGAWEALYAIMIPIGLYLTVVGWSHMSNAKQRSTSNAASGVPHAV